MAAGITPYAVGTETDGSISCPAAFNGCVGIKPTVGLVPTDGVVPISRSQDSPGPMAATVRDAAALLGVLAGNGTDYASYAVDGRLAGKRIGVPRARYWGYSSHADELAERAVQLLAGEGATIVDATDLTSMEDFDGHDELLVMLAELRSGLEGYLAARPGDGPRTLADVVAWNREHADVELAALRPVAVRAGAGGTGHRQPGVRRGAGPLRAGRARRRHRRRAARARPGRAGHPVLRPGRADRPGQPGGAHGLLHQPSAIAGYPLLTVPAGLAAGLPVAVSFWGTAASETTLVEIAARLRGRPATATRGRCRRRPSRPFV